MIGSCGSVFDVVLPELDGFIFVHGWVLADGLRRWAYYPGQNEYLLVFSSDLFNQQVTITDCSFCSQVVPSHFQAIIARCDCVVLLSTGKSAQTHTQELAGCFMECNSDKSSCERQQRRIYSSNMVIFDQLMVMCSAAAFSSYVIIF